MIVNRTSNISTKEKVEKIRISIIEEPLTNITEDIDSKKNNTIDRRIFTTKDIRISMQQVEI